MPAGRRDPDACARTSATARRASPRRSPARRRSRRPTSRSATTSSGSTWRRAPPSAAFAPGFLVDRFFFQSFDAPLARSELLLVTPAGVDARARRARRRAPRRRRAVAVDGTRVTSFQATSVPQLFAERAAVPAIEYVPSVRASSRRRAGGAGRATSARSCTTRFARRPSCASRRGASRRPRVPGDRRALAAALVDWVTENIEATDELADPASFALARGRGSRTALALALARELGIPARPVLARSRLVAEAARADAAAGAGRLRRRARRAGRRRAAASRRSSTPTCACATRRSATCRPGLDGARDAARPRRRLRVRAQDRRRRIAGRST